MTYRDRIEINPLICSGKPVIKGTRIIVSGLISQLADVTPFQGIDSVEWQREQRRQ